jgi:hypothetical protein
MKNSTKIKIVFLDLISFGSPQAILFNLTTIFILLFVTPTKNLVYSPVKCIFKRYLLPLIFRGNCPTSGLFANCEDPACGLTRAVSSLLHGDFSAAWNFNKAVYLLFSVMIIVLIINLVKTIKYYKKHGKIYNFGKSFK